MKSLAIALLLCLAASLAAQAADSTGYRPGDREMFACPTATTLPQYSHQFTCYELFVLDYAYSPLPHFEAGVKTPFPFIVSMLDYTALYAKWNYLRTPTMDTAFGFWLRPEAKALCASNIFSFGNERYELNLVPGVAVSEDMTAFSMMGGFSIRTSENGKIMFDWVYLPSWIENDYDGNMIVGYRWTRDNTYFDFGGFHPFLSNDDEKNDNRTYMIPYIAVGWTFGGF